MNYRSVSCKRIINRAFGAYGTLLSQHSDRLIGEAVDWIGDALEAIGCTEQLVDKTAFLTVKNNKVVIPCDLYLIKSISYKSMFLRYGSQTFNYDMHCDDCVNASIMNVDFSYTVNPNYINTNVPDDEVICVSYQAFPVDEEGFPLIPDKEAVTQCLFWKLTYMLMLGGFEHPNREMSLTYAENHYMKYRGEAENLLAMFDIPRMESFKNQWVRLIPNISTARDFFYSDSIGENFVNLRYNR